MTDKLAVDVVLLPPKEVMKKAIEINHQLVNDQIQLNQENCLPHISLCMGVIEQKKLPEVSKILESISLEFPPLPLTITKIVGETSSGFELEKTNNLQKLHERIIQELRPYLLQDATKEMCSSPQEVVPRTLFWINNYTSQFSGDKFYPHITLAKQELVTQPFEMSFTASRLALCHLGNYCTCRRILFETKLKTSKKEK